MCRGPFQLHLHFVIHLLVLLLVNILFFGLFIFISQSYRKMHCHHQSHSLCLFRSHMSPRMYCTTQASAPCSFVYLPRSLYSFHNLSLSMPCSKPISYVDFPCYGRSCSTDVHTLTWFCHCNYSIVLRIWPTRIHHPAYLTFPLKVQFTQLELPASRRTNDFSPSLQAPLRANPALIE